MMINGITPSYHIHVVPICKSCAELDSELVINHGIGLPGPKCGVCGEILLDHYVTSGTMGMVDKLKLLLRSRKRERKIDDILI